MLIEREVAAAERSQVDSAALLREVEPMVRAICRGRLGEADGDDAAQRALLTVWKKLESERGVDCLPTYAATCARYETLSAYRDFRRSATPAGDLSEALWADPGPGPPEHAERADEVAHARERVEALLAQLTPRQAEVMRATVLADRGSVEAAAELGVTPTGVRSVQTRAMARMRELSGTRSSNPLASELTAAERGKRDRAAARARAMEEADAVGPAAAGEIADKPFDRARAAVAALETDHDATSDASGSGRTDPMDRARAAVDRLPAAADIQDAVGDGAVPIELDGSLLADVEDEMDSGVAQISDESAHAADAAGAA